ncbi:related to PHM7-similarity to A.thaliana hyp1 protein [Fusarium fujikuroi]|nr:related to PHM7-similarity to A.thaliana hyp1 protein [Fusarium fujikuroi]
MSQSGTSKQPGGAQGDAGIGLVSFLTALGSGSVFFFLQLILFLLLRNHLDRIFKPKTYLTPLRERTLPPPEAFRHLIRELCRNDDRDVIEKCGLDAYFFLRYLRVLLVIFVPIACVTISVLVPLNYIGGRGREFNANQGVSGQVTGLDTFAWGNVNSHDTKRYWGHLIVSVLCVLWVLFVFSMEMRVYVTTRQTFLTSKAHRSEVAASTVLVRSIPEKWLREELLSDVFSIFPGGVRRVWLNRDLSSVMAKITLRDAIHHKLEAAETALIQDARRTETKRTKEATRKKLVRSAHPTFRQTDSRPTTGGCNTMARSTSRHALESRWPPGGGRKGPESRPLGHPRAALSLCLDGLTVSRLADLETAPSVPEARSPTRQERGGVLQTVAKAGNQVKKRAMTTNGFVPLPSLVEIPEHKESDWSEKPITMAKKPMATSPGAVVLHDSDRDYSPGTGSWWRLWESPPRHSNPDTVQHSNLSVTRLRRSRRSSFRYRSPYNDAHLTNWKRGLWKGFLRAKSRPTFRLPLLGQHWLPGLPLLSKSVDTIEWCRKELCRLNGEIAEDRRHFEGFPLLDSAFVQFNEQTAAYMACQSAVYCRPGHMTASIIDTSPNDVIWENIGIGYRESWVRAIAAAGMLALMISFWSVPVSWSGALSQVDSLIDTFDWLAFIRRVYPLRRFIQVIAGLLPAAMLATMLFLLPMFLDCLAMLKGVQTHSQKTQFIQKYYFIFLFIQVFLVVSIASFFTASVSQFASNVKSLERVADILDMLARNLPKAANYFYSYMLLQALSTSSATLLQAATLAEWYLVSPIFDATARQKWSRNTRLSPAKYGALFPVYTNFACISLIYCTISPLISIFAILTFGLFYIAQKYTALYVNTFDFDTGGKLYPRAINQTFTGLYTMELCVSGLFFTTRDANGRASCVPQGVIMLGLFMFTVVVQVTLSKSFSPLSSFLPTMLRLCDFENVPLVPTSDGNFAPTKAQGSQREHAQTMLSALHRDPLGEPATREQDSFQHGALRRREPIVWIPQDDLGIAEDEIRQTREFSSNIQIESFGAALDAMANVTYSRNPPDFSPSNDA